MTGERILIFRNQGIGDLMLISPAIRAIRSLHPDSSISVFVGEWSKISVENNPHIDEIISYPDDWIQDKKPFRILNLVNRIRKGGFKRVYIFHSHDMLHLLVRLAGIPERYGFSFKGTGRFLTNKTEWEPNSARYIADNYLDIPRLAGFKGDDVKLDFIVNDHDETEAKKIIKKSGLKPEELIVIAPGGGINPRQDVFEKRWGEDKFVELIEMMQEDGFDIRKIVLVGAKAEKNISDRITDNGKLPVLDLTGEIPFGISAALVKKARLLISNDSSIMHTAVAFHTPSIAIFGPSNPRSLLPASKINRWISSVLDCSPCYSNEIFKGCLQNSACMRELSAETVLKSIRVLLN